MKCPCPIGLKDLKTRSPRATRANASTTRPRNTLQRIMDSMQTAQLWAYIFAQPASYSPQFQKVFTLLCVYSVGGVAGVSPIGSSVS